MWIGTADIDVALAPADEQQGGGTVDHYADRGDQHHHAARHRRRVHQPLARLQRDRTDRDQQQHRVEQGREDGRSAQAVGEALRGGRLANSVPPQAMSSPSTSERLWPASASSDIESIHSPAMPSTSTKPRLSAVPIANARPKSAGAWLWP
jgi:hypothetical protein